MIRVSTRKADIHTDLESESGYRLGSRATLRIHEGFAEYFLGVRKILILKVFVTFKNAIVQN